ncbi:MAG: hypothetical protein J6D28_03580 [Bacilli bacterium]|nr:hypothetical protein [Bacilli bacterium]
MNNKGQVLVVFVILIPIIIISLLILIEFGKLYLEKQHDINVIKETINYGLKHIDDEKINEKINNLIDININYSDKSIFISDDEIRINIKKNVWIFGKKHIVTYIYTGIKNDEVIKIEEG